MSHGKREREREKIKQYLKQRKSLVMMGMLHWLGCNLCLYNAAGSFDIHRWLFLAFCNLSLTFSWHSDSPFPSRDLDYPSVCVFWPWYQRTLGSAIFIALSFLLIFISVAFVCSFLLSPKRHPWGGMLSLSPSQRGLLDLYGLLISNSRVYSHRLMAERKCFGTSYLQRSRGESQLCFNAHVGTLRLCGIH